MAHYGPKEFCDETNVLNIFSSDFLQSKNKDTFSQRMHDSTIFLARILNIFLLCISIQRNDWDFDGCLEFPAETLLTAVICWKQRSPHLW